MNILIVLALLVQDKAAETTFQKIEETLNAAKTLKVSYQVESHIVNAKASVDQTSSYSGSLLLKEGNKALFTYELDKKVSGLSSDGKTALTAVHSACQGEQDPRELEREPHHRVRASWLQGHSGLASNEASA